MSEFEENMERSYRNHRENMDKISKEFEERKKDIDEDIKKVNEEIEKRHKKYTRIFFIGLLLLLFFVIRFNLLMERARNFEKYAHDYSWYSTEKEEKDRSVYDSDIIRNRILPSFLKSLVNPFEWTELQISKDDELLLKCKKQYKIEEEKRKEERKRAEETFNERFKN